MTERDLDRKIAELDRLLNDPAMRMEPDLVWSLLADVSRARGWPARAWIAGVAET
jgi:hypothetical protein